MVKMWAHETERIYGDRLVSPDHLAIYKQTVADTLKKNFAKFNIQKYFQPDTKDEIIFSNFVHGLEDKLYDQFSGLDALNLRLQEALREYNEVNAVMDLVLFEDAMKHICRITRIIGNDGGHALLVGVGGSGK
jgi:dynein heavy chain